MKSNKRKDAETQRRKADAVLYFPPGDYHQALANYGIIKQWAMESGLCFLDGIAGIIKSPTYPGRDEKNHVITGDEIDRTDWETTCEFWVEDHHGIELLLDLIPPPGAALAISDDSPYHPSKKVAS